MTGRDVVDQHVCLPVGRPLFHAIDDIMDALGDFPPLFQRERAFGYIDFGNRH